MSKKATMGKVTFEFPSDEIMEIGVGSIIMNNDQIVEILLYGSEEDVKKRMKVLRTNNFQLESTLYPTMGIDDYDAQYVWHIDYAPVKLHPAKRQVTPTDET